MGSATAFAEKSLECSLQGSYTGYDAYTGNLSWISMAQGQSSSNGSYILDVPGFDSTFGGLYPSAVMGGTLRGVWTRTGDYTFNVTVIGLAVDSGGNSLYIGKLQALDTLAPGCNSMWIEATFEFFNPDENPNEDDPFFAMQLPGHWGYRIVGQLD